MQNRKITDFCRAQLHTECSAVHTVHSCSFRIDDGCHCVFIAFVWAYVRAIVLSMSAKGTTIFSLSSHQTAHDILYEPLRAHSGNESRVVLFARQRESRKIPWRLN